MYIEELNGGEMESGEEESFCTGESVFGGGGRVLTSDAKRFLVGAGARTLFYPTLLYNVVRNMLQEEFRWWDRITEFILLGAVPFNSDVPRLKELGVCGVITLNEPYETLVSTSLYHAHNIDHLVIPTRDYLFAPSSGDITQAVDFIHKNSSNGKTTYVHCKAGRGRSTTIVICYLVQHKHMTPDAAYDYVRSIRPRVLLAPAQLQAVQEYYHLKVKETGLCSPTTDLILQTPGSTMSQKLVMFDDGSVVVVTKSDLDGYDASTEADALENEIWADLNVVYRVRVAGQAALARISCLWLRCQAHQKTKKKLVSEGRCSITADQLGGISLDIHVY